MDIATPEFLTLPDRRLAYQLQRGKPGLPGIIFLGGYASDMMGAKARFLAGRCARDNVSFLRFDYRAHGQSSGDFLDCTLGDWFEDAALIFDKLTNGPQIVIGSSMGGWIGLMLALKKPERVKAFVGIAAGPDFTEELFLPDLPEKKREELDQKGVVYVGGTPTEKPIAFTKKLVEEARRHLLLRGSLPVSCPLRLLQGMQDEDIPWPHALKIARVVPHGDVRITLIKDGGHRLGQPEDLELLWQAVGEFL